MKFLGFRVSEDMHQALLEYVSGEGVTVTECLVKLVEYLLSGEGIDGRSVGVEGRLRDLEDRLDIKKEEVMNKDQVSSVVAEIMDGRDEGLARGITEGVIERIVSGEAENKEQVKLLVGLMDRFTTKLEQQNEGLVRLFETVGKRNVHNTAADMISCPECGTFFLEAVGIAFANMAEQEKLAEAKALTEHSEEVESERLEQAELLSQRWLIVLPSYKGGFRWKDREDGFPGLPASIKCEGYIKVVTDRDEADKYRGKRGVEVLELMPIDGLADYEEPDLKVSKGWFPDSKWDEERQLFVERH